MLNLKPNQYFLLLISSLILSILYLNVFLNYNTGNLKLTSSHTGAISAIPATSISPTYALAITLVLIFAGYFAWVWVKADELKKKNYR